MSLATERRQLKDYRRWEAVTINKVIGYLLTIAEEDGVEDALYELAEEEHKLPKPFVNLMFNRFLRMVV